MIFLILNQKEIFYIFAIKHVKIMNFVWSYMGTSDCIESCTVRTIYNPNEYLKLKKKTVCKVLNISCKD